ncbi:MAG: DUF1549 domain-containing protein [Verrucomicrobiales bacterium]
MPPFTRILAGACAALLCAHPLLAQQKTAPDAAKLRAYALEVDKRIAAHFQKNGLAVPADADPGTLLRRTYLVAVGRIPTLEETRSYLADPAPDKHALLVERLMASPGYASHMSNWLGDLLRVKDQFTNNVSAAPYVHYLRESVASNKSWDQLSTELLTAAGNGWNGAPQIGYFVRDKGMPLDNVANTMRIFLGTRMECAQCHDHPFGDWDRRDFYELAAFFHGIDGKNESVQRAAQRIARGESEKEGRRPKQEDRQLADLIDFLGGNAHYFTVAGGGRGNIPLPADYQYRDGKPGEVVAARAPYGPTMRMSSRREGDDGRLRFVKWMTDAENPQFSQIIANRMWKRSMGRGVYEPVDEYVPAAETSAPELMKYLASLMRELGHDLRAYQQVLLLTRTFRFDTSPQQSEANTPASLAGRQINRLAAEQIWDSLLVLKAGDPDALPVRSFGDSVIYRGRVIKGGELTMGKLQTDLLAIKDPADYIRYAKDLLANSTGASKSDMMMMSGGVSGGVKGLARASELPIPPPGDHFLRRFGASDREVIEGGTKEGTVPQVLALVNGEVQNLLVENDKAEIFRHLAAAPDDEARVRVLFLSTLAREPDPGEMDLMLLHVAEAGPDRAWHNLLASLLCTHEFLFLR